MHNEQAIIEVKTVNVKFKFRYRNYAFWVFEIPYYEDHDLYLIYLKVQLSKFLIR